VYKLGTYFDEFCEQYYLRGEEGFQIQNTAILEEICDNIVMNHQVDV